MSIEDNDNLYILKEEENEREEQQDESPLNFAAYTDEEREEEESEPIEKGKERSVIGMMFRIMFNPVEGWKSLRRSKADVEKFQSGCFYPLLALLAVSTFADFFYSVDVSLSHVVTQAVVTFVAFFFGYFCIQMLLMWILPKDMTEKFDSEYGKKYLIISLSSLAFFGIFTNLLPMLWPILIFLPIWTLYFMFKGVRFFHFAPNQEMKFYIYAAVSVIGMPVLIDWVLNKVMPY